MRHSGSLAAALARNRPSATASSLQKSACTSGPSATLAAPVNVAQSTMSAGASASASASASQRISRPSASVLPISTVLPIRVRMMSRGRMALAETEFSTAGMSTRRRIGAPAAINALARPRTTAPPPMSFFICSIAGGRLEIQSAGIETHAFADQRDFRRGRVAPADVDKARWATARAPHRMNRRIVRAQQIVAADDRALGTRFAGHVPRRGGELVGPHFLRGRIDEVAREEDAARQAFDFRAIGLRRARPGSRTHASASCSASRGSCRGTSRAPWRLRHRDRTTRRCDRFLRAGTRGSPAYVHTPSRGDDANTTRAGSLAVPGTKAKVPGSAMKPVVLSHSRSAAVARSSHAGNVSAVTGVMAMAPVEWVVRFAGIAGFPGGQVKRGCGRESILDGTVPHAEEVAARRVPRAPGGLTRNTCGS